MDTISFYFEIYEYRFRNLTIPEKRELNKEKKIIEKINLIYKKQGKIIE